MKLFEGDCKLRIVHVYIKLFYLALKVVMSAPYMSSSSVQNTSSSQLPKPAPALPRSLVNESKRHQASVKISGLATKTLSTELVPALLIKFTLDPCQLAVSRAWNSPMAKQMLINSFKHVALAKGFVVNFDLMPVNPNMLPKVLNKECLHVLYQKITKQTPYGFTYSNISSSIYKVLFRVPGASPSNILNNSGFVSNLISYITTDDIHSQTIKIVRISNSVWARMITTILFPTKSHKYAAYNSKELWQFHVDRVKRENIDILLPDNHDMDIQQLNYLELCDEITNCINTNNQIEPEKYTAFHFMVKSGLTNVRYLWVDGFDEIISTYGLLTYLNFILRQNISPLDKKYIENWNEILLDYRHTVANFSGFDKETLKKLLEIFLTRAKSTEVQAHMKKNNNLKAYKRNLNQLQEIYQTLYGESSCCVLM